MKYIVDIYGELEGDYEIIKKYDEPKTGEWIDSGYGVECSLCGEWYPHASIARNQLNFCPNCGADMRGKKKTLNEIRAEYGLQPINKRGEQE